MKKFNRKLLALPFALLFVFLIGCSDNSPSQQDSEFDYLDLRLSDLYYANSLENLVYNYGTVSIHTQSADYDYYENYFILNGEIVHTYGQQSVNHFNGLYDIYSFTVDNEDVYAQVYIDNIISANPTPYKFADAVNCWFDNKQFTILSVDDNTITLNINDDSQYTVQVDKNTLAVKQIDYVDDEKITITYSYGQDVMGQNLFNQYAENIKNITVIASMYYDDSYIYAEKRLNLPANWSLEVYGTGQLAYYEDADFTKPFTSAPKYDSYSIYVTNSMG